MNPTISRIIVSFFVAGAWIAASTFLGERLGSRKAGILGNLPSNILISMLFVGLTRGPGYVAEAVSGVPMGMAIDALYVLAFIAVVPYGLAPAMGVSLAVWVACAFLVAGALPPLSFPVSSVIFAVITAAAFWVADEPLKIRKADKKPAGFSAKTMAVRAFFSGSVVAGVVAIAQFAPPYIAGMVATFPAVMTSSLVILTRSQGPDFARATGKILIICAPNIIIYSICAAVLFPALGPWLGTLFSFGVSLLFALILEGLTRRVR